LSKLGDAKTLGGIGSILLLIPGVSIVGYILILIASKYISDDLGDKSIFNNMLYAVITGIVGVAIGISVIFTSTLFSAFSVAAMSPNIISMIMGILVGLAVMWIFLIISSIFIRRAYNTIATRLNVNWFKTAGTLYFVGALLTIVLVGLIVLFIAYIIQIIAFFSIQEGSQPMATQSTAPATSSVAISPKLGAKL
jgi:uncharacterized membrane protein